MALQLLCFALVQCSEQTGPSSQKEFLPVVQEDSIFYSLSEALKSPLNVAFLEINDSDSNQFENFRCSLSKFSRLDEIFYKGNSEKIIKILVEATGKLNIEKLTINFDSGIVSIKDIPSSKLRELKVVSETAISFDTSIRQLQALYVLVLNSNKVFLPTNINELSSLRIVALHGLEELKLPRTFFRLALTQLDLEDSKINFLGSGFCDLKELKQLKLGGTPLGEKEFSYGRKTHRKKYTLAVSDCLPDCKIYVGYFVGDFE